MYRAERLLLLLRVKRPELFIANAYELFGFSKPATVLDNLFLKLLPLGKNVLTDGLATLIGLEQLEQFAVRRDIVRRGRGMVCRLGRKLLVLVLVLLLLGGVLMLVGLLGHVIIEDRLDPQRVVVIRAAALVAGCG